MRNRVAITFERHFFSLDLLWSLIRVLPIQRFGHNRVEPSRLVESDRAAPSPHYSRHVHVCNDQLK